MLDFTKRIVFSQSHQNLNTLIWLCVYYSSDHPGVDGSGQIEKLQEKALMELQDYVQKSYPDDIYRLMDLSHFYKFFDLWRSMRMHADRQEDFKRCAGRKLKELRLCFGRLTRILTRLPALRLMNSSITEELFFTGLIGNVSIDSIIPYILKMETAEYNSQDCDPTGWQPGTTSAGLVSFCAQLPLLPPPFLDTVQARLLILHGTNLNALIQTIWWNPGWPWMFFVCLFRVNTVVLWVVNSHWTDKKKKSFAAATLLTFQNDFVTLWIG